MKEHEIREVVNKLRDIAIKYHAADQLRSQIAKVIVPLLYKIPTVEEPHDEREI